MSEWTNADIIPTENCRAIVTAIGRNGRRYVMAGQYYHENTLPLHENTDPFDGCTEAGGEIYAPAGWYEQDHIDDCAPIENIQNVTQWTPMPKPVEES